MMFCPKCGALMISTTCKCGYTAKKIENMEIKEKVITTDSKIEIVDGQEDSMLPETDADCPNCHNKKAVFWMVQTRAGDEPETKFLKCTKCKHVWRDYK
jgi:transcription factor S